MTSVSLDQSAPRHLRRVHKGLLDYGMVQSWIGELVQTSGGDLFRMKGVLAVAHSKQRFVFHGVHMVIHGAFEDQAVISPLLPTSPHISSYLPISQVIHGAFEEPWAEGEERESKLVFIGKNLDGAALAKRFNACLATPENIKQRAAALRFAVGERVECRMGGGWHAGAVVAQMYRDDVNMSPVRSPSAAL